MKYLCFEPICLKGSLSKRQQQKNEIKNTFSGETPSLAHASIIEAPITFCISGFWS